MPLVSVVMSVYNGGAFVGDAIESILRQTLSDFELIVVDDASTDDSSAVLAGFRDSRLRVLKNGRNMGLARSLNRAITSALGAYIARQDADDLSLPNRLELEAEFLRRHSEVGLVGSPAIVINEAGADTGVWGVPCADIDIKWTLLFCNPFVHTSVMFRRTAVESAGAYSEDSRCAYTEDYDLWLRLAVTSELANLQAPLVQWRDRTGSVSSRNQQEQRKQIQLLSGSSVQKLLEPEHLNPTGWSAFRKLVRASPRERVNLDSSEVDSGVRVAQQIRQAFYRYYRFECSVAHSHHRRCCWLWGKHMLALACTNNGSRDLGCRLTLLAAGMKLLSSAGRSTAA